MLRRLFTSTGKNISSIFHSGISGGLPCKAANTLVVQRRSAGANTVNFFQRRTENVLWNSVTQITHYGARKGRQRTRQSSMNLQKFYRLGKVKTSPMRLRYPGLNARVDPTGASPELYIESQTEEERQQVFQNTKVMMERQPKKKIYIKEALSPWERGFSSGTMLGQKMGPPPPNKEEGVNYDDFECICFEIKRTCSMESAHGRVAGSRALVFIGNGKGVGGYALCRAGSYAFNLAISKAIKQASRRLFHVELFEGRTIYQDFFGEYRDTRVFAQRKEAGYGVVAHPRIKKICQLLGIKDIYVRVDGSTRNHVGVCHAFVTGLHHQETHHQLAERTRLHVVELSPNRQFLPKIVASPLKAPVKTEEEVEPIERMRLEDFYGEGRFPLHWGPSAPFYRNAIGHLHAEWKKHPFRNMEKKIIRLLADGTVRRWTRRERKRWSDREQLAVEMGQKPLPMGIGLSDWVPMEGEEDGEPVGPAPFLGNPDQFRLTASSDAMMDGECGKEVQPQQHGTEERQKQQQQEIVGQ